MDKEERLNINQKLYEELNKQYKEMKKINGIIIKSKKNFDKLSKYYFGQWMEDREIDMDNLSYPIVSEDLIFGLLTDYYELVEKMTKNINKVEKEINNQ